MRVLVVVVAVVALGVSATAGRGADDGVPAPLTGIPLTEPTGIQLVAADAPPLVLDVDSGRVSRVRGLDVLGRPVLTVLGAGDATVVWIDTGTNRRSAPTATISIVPKGSHRATRIGSAWEVAPSADGDGLWLKRHLDRYRCTLREVALDGSSRTRARSVPCATRLVDAGGRALLVRGEAVLDPTTGRVLVRTPRLLALAGSVLVTASGQAGSLLLTDLADGRVTSLDYPSRITGQGGYDQAAVDPSGTLVAAMSGCSTRRPARCASCRHARRRVAQADEHGLDSRRPARASHRGRGSDARRRLAARADAAGRSSPPPARAHERERRVRRPLTARVRARSRS